MKKFNFRILLGVGLIILGLLYFVDNFLHFNFSDMVCYPGNGRSRIFILHDHRCKEELVGSYPRFGTAWHWCYSYSERDQFPLY